MPVIPSGEARLFSRSKIASLLDRKVDGWKQLSALLSNMRTLLQKAEQVFEAHGGMLRTMEAQRVGIHPRTLYALRDTGKIEQVARGL